MFHAVKRGERENSKTTISFFTTPPSQGGESMLHVYQIEEVRWERPGEAAIVKPNLLGRRKKKGRPVGSTRVSEEEVNK